MAAIDPYRDGPEPRPGPVVKPPAVPYDRSLGEELLKGQLSQELFIPGRFPTLNEIFRDSWLFVREKKKLHQRIALLARAQGFKPVTNARFWFWLSEPDKRRDPDGFCSVASKIVLDALQHAGLLEGDGWSCNRGMTFNWHVGEAAVRVLVVGDPWEETENERREKGKAKFQRKKRVAKGNRRNQRHPALGGPPAGAPKGRRPAVRDPGH